MTKINDGGYVAPQRSNIKAGGGPYREETPGMSMRQFYAAKALPAIIQVCGGDDKLGMTTPDYFAFRALEIADAMIAAELTSADAQNKEDK